MTTSLNTPPDDDDDEAFNYAAAAPLERAYGDDEPDYADAGVPIVDG